MRLVKRISAQVGLMAFVGFMASWGPPMDVMHWSELDNDMKHMVVAAIALLVAITVFVSAVIWEKDAAK